MSMQVTHRVADIRQILIMRRYCARPRAWDIEVCLSSVVLKSVVNI